MTETPQIEAQNHFATTTMPNLITQQPLPSQEFLRNTNFLDLNKKIVEQNKSLLDSAYHYKTEMDNLNTQLEVALSSLEESLSRVNQIKPHKPENPLAVGLEHKIAEFKRLTEANNEKIKKNNETLPEIQRKKKENDDFFKKFHGEKKVWLDRLKEIELRNDLYEKGFKYFYEAKTVKLLLEGIMLEKVQDAIEKELTTKGELMGYGIMDEQKAQEERKQEEFDFNSKLLTIGDPKEAARMESEQRANWEKEDRETKQKRERIMAEWKQLWGEIWLPNVPLNEDRTVKTRRDLIKQVTMDVTFNVFKTLCFDVWKFKNIINSADEYVVLDKVRKYFPEETNSTNKDEAILNKMMDIIENIKQEEEIIYCDLKPAKKTLSDYQKSAGEKSDINASINRLKVIIDKIESVHNALEIDSSKLIKTEIEEIKTLIKNIPDDNEKKLFKDNLLDEGRLYDRFLPLTNLLMVVSFISIGKKRNKGYQDKIDKINKENENLKFQNKEIDGKLQLLNEVKEKIENEQVFEITTPGYDGDYEKELEGCRRAKSQMASDLNSIKNDIAQIKNENNDYLAAMNKCFVTPYKLEITPNENNTNNREVDLNQINPTFPVDNINKNFQQ